MFERRYTRVLDVVPEMLVVCVGNFSGPAHFMRPEVVDPGNIIGLGKRVEKKTSRCTRLEVVRVRIEGRNLSVLGINGGLDVL